LAFIVFETIFPGSSYNFLDGGKDLCRTSFHQKEAKTKLVSIVK